jgi:hypothetical protein
MIRVMQIKTTMTYKFLSNKKAIKFLKRKITCVDNDVEKLEPSCTSGGNVKWVSNFGKELRAPQKAKYRIAMLPNYSTSGHIIKSLYRNILSSRVHKGHKAEFTNCGLDTKNMVHIWD